jgi:hypothetical protein
MSTDVDTETLARPSVTVSSSVTTARPSSATVHLQAWASEFLATLLLLFVAVSLARWLFGPRSVIASGVPGLE